MTEHSPGHLADSASSQHLMKLETKKAKSLRETHVTGVRVDDRVLLFCVRLVSYD